MRWNVRTNLQIISAVVFLASACGASIPAGKRGLEVRAFGGGMQRTVRADGFYFQWPWNSMVIYDVTWQTRTEDIDILTADDLHVKTQVAVTFRPIPTELYKLHTEIGRDYYESVIRPAFVTITRSQFADHQHNRLPEESPRLETQIGEGLRAALAGKALEIDRVSIVDVDFEKEVTGAIARKLSAAQAVEQKKFDLEIAEREGEITRTRARAEAESGLFGAEAEARAIVLRGEAQAKAQQAIAKTLTPAYIQLRAFESQATRWIFAPLGKTGLPVVLDTR